MNNIHIISLPYLLDSTIYFEAIANNSWSFFLDSCVHDGSKEILEKSRYDIIVSQPFIRIIADESSVVVEENNQRKIFKKNPFEVLDKILLRFKVEQSLFPFSGGAVGYFSYELGQENLNTKKENVGMPLMMVGIYDWGLIIDHKEKKTSIVTHHMNRDTKNEIDKFILKFKSIKSQNNIFKIKTSPKALFDFKEYDYIVNKILSFIREGDVYQINLSNKYLAECEGDSWVGYRKFREISQSPFMAYLHFDDYDILCASPERFIHVKESNIVETRPIKGTEPRSSNPEIDKRNAEKLLNSEKDRAENLMIVDLLRNDLGKNCISGSVKVKALCELKSYTNVHHLESIIEGELKSESSLVQLFKDCFPGGSITGAPKERSMQIINDIEPHSRDIYCGSIGYFGFNRKMDTNIAIRTIVRKGNELHYYSGGGIVAGSNSKNEFDEISHKAANITKWIHFFS